MVRYKKRMAKHKKKTAIFDIDGTIFRSSLLIELVNALIQDKIFKPSARKLYAREYTAWLNRRGRYEDYLNKVVEAFRRNIRGVRYPDFMRVARRVVTLHKNRTYRFTRDLVHQLKRHGYFLLAISHSPKVMVRIFSQNLGFDKSYAMKYEISARGKFNGAIVMEDFIMNKAHILRHAVQKYNLTLRGSVGVGDTESDIPFLKLVDRPICFNPNKKLFACAKKQKWEIVVERKDVISTL